VVTTIRVRLAELVAHSLRCSVDYLRRGFTPKRAPESASTRLPISHGSPNHAHAHLRQLIEVDGDKVVAAVVSAALGGDMHAAKLIIDRILPKRVCRTFDGLVLPPIRSVTDACEAMAVITSATLRGDISTQEANELAQIIGIYECAVANADVVARLERLEQLALRNR
jgi:hypothetical protein